MAYYSSYTGLRTHCDENTDTCPNYICDSEYYELENVDSETDSMASEQDSEVRSNLPSSGLEEDVMNQMLQL